jgi:diketogulonate reductase-like aldo/keto reductase
MNRRDCLNNLKALGVLSLDPGWMTSKTTLLKRTIHSTGEQLPAIGVGTWQTFDVSDAAAERDPLKEVLKTLISKGGTVIDSSPMYGRSEGVVGDLSFELGLNDKLFIATKVWTTGRDNGVRQMNASFRLMKRQKIELMQIHNLTDWETHIKTLRSWKEQGKIKYIGLTHYTDSAHDRLINILSRETIDFIQINYNLVDRHAEERLLPFAREKNVAVLVNQPFESGSLFRRVRGKEVPAWAKDFDCDTWAQFFLKFILSHPAVTCAIPGTDKPQHMLDNIGAAYGGLPDEKQRRQMVRWMEEI